MKGQAIAYRLESFEGPLDLLLHLISKNKVSVYDIPIAQILEQYLEHIRRMRELDMDVASEFIAMAAQLMYIKSKMLLPARQEEEAQPDPRAPLVEALLEYQRFKRAGELLQQREELGRDLYAKPPESREASQVQYAYTAQALGRAVPNILERYDRKAPPPAGLFRGVAGADPAPVSAKIGRIVGLLADCRQIRFESLVLESRSRSEIVSVFLAVLELLKIRKIALLDRQGEYLITLAGDGDGIDGTK